MGRRLSLLGGLGVLVFLAGAKGPTSAPVDLGETERMSVLEGTVKVRPERTLKCILLTDGGQICVLRPAKKVQGDRLQDIEDGSRVQVEGRLDSYYYDANDSQTPNAGPSTWVIYMLVKQVRRVEKPPVMPPAAPLPTDAS